MCNGKNLSTGRDLYQKYKNKNNKNMHTANGNFQHNNGQLINLLWIINILLCFFIQ